LDRSPKNNNSSIFNKILNTETTTVTQENNKNKGAIKIISRTKNFEDNVRKSILENNSHLTSKTIQNISNKRK